MKRSFLRRLPLALGLALLTAACVRLDTPLKKTGYAIGQSDAQNVARFKDRLDLGQLYKGLDDQIAGKSSMAEDEIRNLLNALGSGQVADKAKTGYAVGASLGLGLAPWKEFADLAFVKTGLKDALNDKHKLAPQDMGQLLGEMQGKLREKLAARNKAEGAAYLAQNKAKKGVKTTASGLQLEELRPGKGARPRATDQVKVNYLGTLVNGTKFDSSYDRNQPAVFPLNGVIKGWTEGMQLMRVGGKYRLVIPSELAYGPNGMLPVMGPDAVLVFEVELLEVIKPAKAAAAPAAAPAKAAKKK